MGPHWQRIDRKLERKEGTPRGKPRSLGPDELIDRAMEREDGSPRGKLRSLGPNELADP